jgi:magnesium-transporting ATPase (P-type)
MYQNVLVPGIQDLSTVAFTLVFSAHQQCLLPSPTLPLPVLSCALLLQTGWPELAPGVGSWLVQVVRFIILLAQAVPISLYVSLETVKVAQCKVR